MPTLSKDRLHGTLDALVLKTLSWGPRHGYAIARWLEEKTGDAIQVEEGSRVAIAQVDFRGNKVFTDDVLRGAIDTKKEGFLWFRGGKLDDAMLTKDLKDNLPEVEGAGACCSTAASTSSCGCNTASL